jgi:hypothetical protein
MTDLETRPNIKLNVFALPSQTAILAGLIVTVLIGSMLIGSVSPVWMCLWPLALGLLVLPLREFIARPERDIAHYRLSPAGAEFQEVQRTIEIHAQTLGLRRRPQLQVSNQLKEIYTFGSFRHWYIALGLNAAQALEQELINPESAPTAQAKIIHELYHFKTGDYWQLGYVEALLSLTLRLTTWATFFFFGLSEFLSVMVPYFINVDLPHYQNEFLAGVLC